MPEEEKKSTADSVTMERSVIEKREKSSAALSSVVAAVALTLFKTIVGLMTNSLGILAEAAHSGLDLIAAVMTFVAVRISGKPPDLGHHYGHGKVENLSAMVETLILLVTCVWIVYESIQRLFFKQVEVDPSFWAFLIMGTSIVVDYSRSRILYRAARKYRSQALEADALHFSTDIWSSSVVIGGLIALRVNEIFPSLHFLDKADALAALAVAVIVVYVSLQLGRRTLYGLLDHAPPGLREQIEEAVDNISGIYDCHRIRIRISGAHYFVDLHIKVDPNQTLDSAHELTVQVEQTIKQLLPSADVTVHPEPAE